MNIPIAVWLVFLFLLGISTGSFLNVVVYRLPRGMSIVRPGSHCVTCHHAIAWYDNLPVVAWLLLRGHCRHCGARFSIRYPLIELLTGLLFVGLYGAYFFWHVRETMPRFEQGGWLVYAGHITLIAALLASSLIDREHWIIPLSISYLVVLVGAVLSMIWPYALDLETARLWRLIPYVGPKAASTGLGAGLGLLLGLFLLKTGLIKRSFVELDEFEAKVQAGTARAESPPPVNIRREMVREVTFLAPAIILGLVSVQLLTGPDTWGTWWQRILSEQKWLAGLLGSLFGFIIGGTVVWATRIFGSLLFGREAMGLGDVHLMAAVGAVLGWPSAVLAFFVAPFIGLGWALTQLVIRRTREIWYGPFLSLATVAVMLMHDPIVDYFLRAVSPPSAGPWPP